MMRWWILGHLLLLSAEDMRTGQLSMLPVAELGTLGFIRAVLTGGAIAWQPGILLLAAGYVSKERVGYGDGWLVLALGMWLTCSELLYVLVLGAFLCLIYGCAAGKKELPFVPFLTSAYITGGWI